MNVNVFIANNFAEIHYAHLERKANNANSSTHTEIRGPLYDVVALSDYRATRSHRIRSSVYIDSASRLSI